MPETGQEPGPRALEAQRLKALHSLQLLDTPREERFDRVTRLAQRMFGVPVVSVSLIDAERHWSKAEVGLGVRELPRSESICSTTVTSDEPLVVPDLASDERFRELASVRGEPHLRFYAGQPLTAAGQRVGSLCIIDDHPREMSTADIDLLRELADLVEKELAAEQELSQAADVQRRLLPSRAPDVPGLEVAGRCRMARQVGGDFYDWFVVQEQLQVELGDVMGKGIAAAIIAAGVRAVLRGASRFNALDEAVTRSAFSLEGDLSETGTFVTAFVARIDPGTGALTYVDAGHGLAVVLEPGGGQRTLDTGGLPLGALPEDRWEAATTVLAPGEALVIASDGVLDLYDDVPAALDAAASLHGQGLDAQGFVDALSSPGTVTSAGAMTSDDVTVVVVRRVTEGAAVPDTPGESR